MSLEPSQPIYDHSTLYLVQLEELILEMTVGMSAIESNSVETLKASVTRQEFLCANLAATSVAGGSWLQKLSHSVSPNSETFIEVAIWKASNTIRQLNLQYAALLKHSGRSIAMLSALCSNHMGRFNEPQGTWSKQQTWSCEI